jgi:hypothetical protein
MRRPRATPRQSPTERGYDVVWEKARAKHLRAEPYCRMCAMKGKLVKAVLVDHVIAIRQRPDLRLNPRNFMSLCQPHHDLLTFSIDAGDLRGATDFEGNPLDPAHPWNAADNADAIGRANQPFKRQAPPVGLTALLKRQALGGRR